MNNLDIRAQIEEEITWRYNEIRFLKNQLPNIPKESDKEKYRNHLLLCFIHTMKVFVKHYF